MDLRTLVAHAIDEDLGPGDLTTEATVDARATGSGVVRAKQDLVVCGHEVAREVFDEVGRRTGGALAYEVLKPDGTAVARGTEIARVHGSLRTLLIGERTALNFLMRLCGIATNVRAYVEAAGEGGPRVVDTRKTTPLHRALEKLAVRTGGAANHRFALYDGVLIKDNHITAGGGITAAVHRARAHAHHLVRIEVEVADLDGLREALDAGADAVLLDNMSDEALAEAVRFARARRPEVLLEASGNMDPTRIAAIRDLGLDFVSAGGLIHQARWVDLSLKIVQDAG